MWESIVHHNVVAIGKSDELKLGQSIRLEEPTSSSNPSDDIKFQEDLNLFEIVNMQTTSTFSVFVNNTSPNRDTEKWIAATQGQWERKPLFIAGNYKRADEGCKYFPDVVSFNN